MTQPLTKRERRIKRKYRRREAELVAWLQQHPLVNYGGQFGVFVPVQHDPNAGPGLRVIHTKR